MCLQLKNSKVKPKIATKDITCYKIVINRNDILRTPYQNTTIEIDKTYISTIDKYNDTIEQSLHSFKLLKDSILWSGRGEGLVWGGWGFKYIKCIIPKGSTYYTGDFNGLISYASDKLTYVKIVK